MRAHHMQSNGKASLTESDETDTPEEKLKTPEPTFQDEPRYDPPETPKKSPQKNGNPMLRLAIPRSAKGRKTAVTFKEEREKLNGPAKYKTDSELDLSDDEAEQDEVLSLDTFTQEILVQPSNAVPTTGTKETNNCTDIVPLFPSTSKKNSMTDLVPVEKVEIKSLSNFASGLITNKTSSVRLPLTGPGGGGGTPYSFSSPRTSTATSSLRPVGVISSPSGGQQQGGVLKLNVAIAGEFTMGNFTHGQSQQ